jgi:TolA-binding protein
VKTTQFNAPAHSPASPLADQVQAHNDEVALLEDQLAQLDDKIAQLKKLLPHLKKENWQKDFGSEIMKKRA